VSLLIGIINSDYEIITHMDKFEEMMKGGITCTLGIQEWRVDGQETRNLEEAIGREQQKVFIQFRKGGRLPC
jgi:hypothetical protein